MKKWLHKLYRFLLPACYIVAVVVWLIIALAHFAGDGLRAEQALRPLDATPENVQLQADGTLYTLSIDPQLVWEGLDADVRTVRLAASFSLPEGEMELFYTRKAGQGFSVATRAIGAPQADGSYLYTLPVGRVHSLRLDMGGANENTVAIGGIMLNPRLPAAHYFLPTLRDIMTLLIIPALACCVIYTILEGVKSRPVRRLWGRIRPQKAQAGGER